MRRVVLGLSLVLIAASCSGSQEASPHAASTTGPPKAAVARGQVVGWHQMAYLASNPTFVSIEMQTRAPAGVVVGQQTSVAINADPLSKPVWVSIEPTRLTVRARDGSGVIQIRTQGCPAQGSCDRRPLYALTGTPIPHPPPGGVVTRQGFVLHIETTAIQPGRYDLALPIRYPSSATQPAVLDAHDSLHVRIDVYAQPPPRTNCTPADLHQPTAIIPASHVLTDTIALEGGSTRLDPPPHRFRPNVSAERARKLLSAGRGPGGGGEATLVLASVSEMQSGVLPQLPELPGGGERPVGKVTLSLRPHKVVAWVLYTQHVAVNANSIPRPAPGPGDPTTPPNACFFVDGITSINATTGAQMDSGGGSASPDPIHF